MSKRIRGITVEIGGDVTRLDRALSGTNKQISKTQAALRDVEKLLKLDPGNTELLAQRQRLLAQAAEETSHKLDTLRQAAQGADAALQRGADYQARYEPLKRSLDEVSATLRGLEANEEEMARRLSAGTISTESYDRYQAKLEETRQAQQELVRSIKALSGEFAGAKLDQGQYDALQREIIQTSRELEELERQAKASGESLGELGDRAQEVGDQAGKISAAVTPASQAMLALGGAALATVPATEDMRASLSMLENNARGAGVGLSAVERAFQTCNLASGELDSSVEGVSNLLQAGFTESNLQQAVEGLAGAFLTFPDTLKIESLADSLQETLATGAAVGQFAELLDRVGLGAEEFSHQLALCPTQAEAINLALTALARTGMNEAYQSWTVHNGALVESRQATMALQQATMDLAESVQPVLTAITQAAAGFLDFFNQLPAGAKAAAAGLAVFVAVLGPITGLVSTITGLLGAAAAASTTFSIAGTAVTLTLGQWLLVVGLVVAAVMALVAAVALLTGAGKDLKNVEVPTADLPAGASARSAPVLQTADLPHLASGGLARRGRPFVAVVGDNPTEDEIIAPHSAIRQAAAEGVGDALRRRGGSGGPVVIEVTLDGAPVGRGLIPYLDAEGVRTGSVRTRTTIT